MREIRGDWVAAEDDIERVAKEYSEGFDIFHVIGGGVSDPGSNMRYSIRTLENDPSFHVISEYDQREDNKRIDASLEEQANSKSHQLYIKLVKAKAEGDLARAEELFKEMQVIEKARAASTNHGETQ